MYYFYDKFKHDMVKSKSKIFTFLHSHFSPPLAIQYSMLLPIPLVLMKLHFFYPLWIKLKSKTS